MKVREKFKDNGLFTAMSEIKELSYMGLISPKNMDILYIANNGFRNLSYMGENYTVSEIAEIMVEMFANKWDKLYEIAIAELPIDYNYTETMKEVVDDDGSNEVNYSSTDTGLVNAYNDEDFVNDTKQDVTTKNSGTNSNLRNREYTKSVLQGDKTANLESIKNYLQNNYFNDIIIKDVNDFLTLSIFD